MLMAVQTPRYGEFISWTQYYLYWCRLFTICVPQHSWIATISGNLFTSC